MTDEPNKAPKARRTGRQVYRIEDVPEDLLAALAASEPCPESEAVEQELSQVATDEATEAEARRRVEAEATIGRIAAIDKSLGLDD